jgi:hypothetical protein
VSPAELVATLPEDQRDEGAALVAEITAHLCRRWGLHAGTELGWRVSPRFTGGVLVTAHHPDAQPGDDTGSSGLYDRRGPLVALRLWVGFVRDEGGAQ